MSADDDDELLTAEEKIAARAQREAASRLLAKIRELRDELAADDGKWWSSLVVAMNKTLRENGVE